MHDLENVIKELTVRIQSDSEEWNTIELPIKQAEDILALLKEQEPVKPDSFMDGRVQRFACKKCGKHLLYAVWGRDNYCSKCGRPVKWE